MNLSAFLPKMGIKKQAMRKVKYRFPGWVKTIKTKLVVLKDNGGIFIWKILTNMFQIQIFKMILWQGMLNRSKWLFLELIRKLMKS